MTEEEHDRQGGPAPDGGAEEGRAAVAARERPTPFTQIVGRVVLVILAVLFVVFAVVNSQYVPFDWIFGETEVTEVGGERVSGGVPLILLLVASFVLGGIVGAGATRRRSRLRRAANTGEREQPG